MRPRSPVSTPFVAAALAVGALLVQPAAAQYGRAETAGISFPWENNRIRLSYLSVEPGSSLPAGGDRVLIYLTADPEGRLPAEAVWQPASSGGIQNRGSVRLEAISIELKDASPGPGGGTPPEAFETSYFAWPYSVSVSTLIDNSRILVSKHRYAPHVYTAPLHFHAEDMLVVYLRGGYSWPAAGAYGSYRVRRGDVDIVPANTFHTLGNSGGDPLELLMIVPR